MYHTVKTANNRKKNIQQMAELLIISIMYQYKPATPQ